MRLLLDENLDERLRYSFPTPHSVETVRFRKWEGHLDGSILQLARSEFDILITADQKLTEEQVVSEDDGAVIVLHGKTNRLVDHLTMLPEVLAEIESIERGQIVRIYQSQ